MKRIENLRSENLKKMPKKIINYGLYGETDKRFVPDFAHFETIKTRSAAHNWAIQPHIHTQLFQLSFIESCAAGTVSFDAEKRVLTPPCLVYVPQNTVHGFDFNPDAQGYVIVASVSFIDDLFKDSPNILHTLSKPQILISAQTDMAMVAAMIEKIRLEFKEDLPERATALRQYFGFLLLSIFRHSDNQNAHFSTNNRYLAHFYAFQKSIKTANSLKKTVAEYATELGITPIHLNRICQSVAGKSASQIVQEYLISEAEKHLMRSDLSVSEVAYLLDFENLSYFTRLFKKHLGVSPLAFRKKGNLAVVARSLTT